MDHIRSGYKIDYIDQQGRKRYAEFIEHVEGLVPWRKDHPPSPAARWRLDDGGIVQIPWAAWELVKDVKDETRNEHGNKTLSGIY